MKWVILMSIIMVGCILEPRPEEREYREVHINGFWIDVVSFHTYEIDNVFSGTGDTLLCKPMIENRNFQYDGMLYGDTIEMIINDTFSVKMVDIYGN